MRCPKCKEEIQDKSLKCTHCGARIASLCKKCGAYNSVYNLNCVNCNSELLKLCPSCKAVNFPDSKACRKCGYGFIEEPEEKIEQQVEKEEIKAEKDIPLNYTIAGHSQIKAKELLLEGILSDKKTVISLSGEKGIGKSVVLKSAINDLQQESITWLLAECTAVTQLSPCGAIQDLFLTFFNVANFCSDSLKLKKDSQKFFQSEFPELTNDEIFNLLNFLYPSNESYYENILENKEKTFTFLEKVFKKVIEANKTVFIIDNFNLIDGMSYEFFHRLLNNENILKTYKFILTYSDVRPARGYLYSNTLDNDAYLDLTLNPFEKAQVNEIIEHYLGSDCPGQVKLDLATNSGGNPAQIEQYVSLLLDFGRKNNSYDITLPQTFGEAVKMRLEYLKQDNFVAYNVLVTAAIQGLKFSPPLINNILGLSESDFVNVLNSLIQLNFINPVSEISYSFKNSVLWSYVFEIVKNDEKFKSMAEKLFEIYSGYTLSSQSMLAVLAEKMDRKADALAAWTENTKLTSYIGDVNLYVISQKQSLLLTEQLQDENTQLIRNNIYERLGKLLASSNPWEAVEYLPEAISNAQKLESPLKEVELTGYLASCCMSLGDYYSTVECIDSAIERISPEFDLELALLKQRKLDALLNIGNSGQIVNLIDNEILPVLELHVGGKHHKNIPMKTIYGAWLKTYLSLANALVFQGNNRSFEVLNSLFDIFKRNNFDDTLFLTKAKLALAFANTIKGDLEESEQILEAILKENKTDVLDNEAISRWNFVNILNNFFRKKYGELKEELYEVVTFANNVNDNFTKNILKTLLGKIIHDEQSAKKALEIYSEQITYFAKEKNAIGALLTWYLIAEAELVVNGPEKALDVAQKALDVAQEPKINNYFFIALLNKVMAEAYMAQSEYELAKVSLEKAILVARKFEMLDLLARLYLMYGKYLQDMALVNSETRADYASGAFKMYKKAGLIANALKNQILTEQSEKAQTVLKSFCSLNNIDLR